MSGTHRDFLFRSKSRCFATKKPHMRAGTLRDKFSGANHAVLHAQKDR